MLANCNRYFEAFIPVIIIVVTIGTCVPAKTVAQNGNTTIYFIDSIPILKDPEPWDNVIEGDIADFRIVRNKDSLRLAGWPTMDAMIYLFTHAFRNRPDSIKQIPSLKQMTYKDGFWHLKGAVYTGSYIDYYYNGNMQNKGTILTGKLEGEVKVFFRNGQMQSISNYNKGVLEGVSKTYYKNNQLEEERNYKEGKQVGSYASYYYNGQIRATVIPKKETVYDTAIEYYSTGAVIKAVIRKNGIFEQTAAQQSLHYYNNLFFSALHAGKLKEANRSLYQIWLIDSSSAESFFKEGMLAITEQRFDHAISSFSRAINIEPLMRESLTQRAIARIKKYKLVHTKLYKHQPDTHLTELDMTNMPPQEQCLACADLLKADEIDPSDIFVKKLVPFPLFKYCSLHVTSNCSTTKE